MAHVGLLPQQVEPGGSFEAKGRDLVGLSGSRLPRFVKQYSTLPESMTASVRAYAAEVRARQFPTEAHTYAIAPDQLRAFREQFSKL